jgi:ATP-dependent DNA helicase RecQ
MSSSEYGDERSSGEIEEEDDGGLFVQESFFGPLPWSDSPLTPGRLAKVVSEWVDKDWKLRAGQFEVVKALRPSGRVFCGFPTAAGKTLIACANPLLDFVSGIAGVHIICQPLQALVGQTAEKMRSLYFSRTKVEVVVWDKQAAVGVVDIDFREKVVVILSSPEKLDDVFAVCAKCRAYVRGLMIDEAHLREEWPFRNYLASDRFTSVYPIAMVGIFSATLENATIEALKTSMGLFDCKVFDRNSVPALRELEEKRLRQLVIRCCQLDELKKRVLVAAEGLASNDSIVIFAATYDVLTSADGLVFCKELAHLNPMVYAASFDPKVRERVIAKFSSGECRFVVATCAFGTGVDFPNIRYVFFDHAPKTWSGFMQHAGRAGRGDLAKQVFITVACGPTDLKACDRRVQILAFYCPATKSGAKKVQTARQSSRAHRLRLMSSLAAALIFWVLRATQRVKRACAQ